MLQQLYTIARNTFIESIRQPVYVVLILIGFIAQVVFTASAAYTLSDDNRLLIDMGVALLGTLGLVLAAFTAAGVVNEEIENKTVLTVISKPVARPLFILGKFLGVAAAMTVALWILTIGLLLCVRHGVMQTASHQYDGPVLAFGLSAIFFSLAAASLTNYLYRWVFTSTLITFLLPLMTLALLGVMLIGKQWTFQSFAAEFGEEGMFQSGQLLVVILVMFEAVLLLTAVAVCASTRLGWVMTLVVCLAVMALGLLNEKMLYEGVAITEPLAAQPGILPKLWWLVAAIPSWIVPNFQFLWLTDALHQKHTIPWSHVGWLTMYCGLFVVAVLSLAVNLFQTREVS